jgi:hypothetical protein
MSGSKKLNNLGQTYTMQLCENAPKIQAKTVNCQWRQQNRASFC